MQYQYKLPTQPQGVTVPPPEFDHYSGTPGQTVKPIRIKLRTPVLGQKITCIREMGTWILEDGPAMISGIACTHAGSGAVVIYDGVPNDDGIFPELPRELFKVVYTRDANGTIIQTSHQPKSLREMNDQELEMYFNRNGRDIFFASPAILGMWMLNGGCNHGYTILSRGDHPASAPIMTLTWMPSKR